MTVRKKNSRTSNNGQLRISALLPPPGTTVERYELHDLRNFDGDDLSGNTKKYVLSIWTTLRDKLIDNWLSVERILRTACVILLSESETVRPHLWEVFKKQNSGQLIDITYDLLKSKGYEVPTDFKQNLKKLVNMRNILAHLASRPMASKTTDRGLVFLKSTGFNEAEYIEVSFEEIESTINDINPIMEWLVQAIPEADRTQVTMDDNVLDNLEAAKGTGKTKP